MFFFCDGNDYSIRTFLGHPGAISNVPMGVVHFQGVLVCDHSIVRSVCLLACAARGSLFHNMLWTQSHHILAYLAADACILLAL